MNRFHAGLFHRLAVLLAALLLLVTLAARASAKDTNFSGRYELADGKASRTFTLSVDQKGTRATVNFAAAMNDGSGAAPDATGKGHVEDGVLSFKFKDSFSNEGTCVLQPTKKGYTLAITVTKIAEAKPLHFYGTMLMRKMSGEK